MKDFIIDDEGAQLTPCSKTGSKKHFIQENTEVVHAIFLEKVTKSAFDTSVDFMQLIKKAFADMVILEIFHKDQIQDDTFREAIQARLFLFLKFLYTFS